MASSGGGDFTYNQTAKGWLYHAVVMDLSSRKEVGWSFSRQRNAELTKSALCMDFKRHPVISGCIFHSQEGIEYAAQEYRELVEAAEMTRSMSRRGNPLDNAVVESFFHSLKSVVIYQQIFRNPIEATTHIIEYIAFYNHERLRSGLDYKSPEDFEGQCACKVLMRVV